MKIREPKDDADRVYTCKGCSTLRSANEGGFIFVYCDKCWKKRELNAREKSTRAKHKDFPRGL